MFVIQKMVLRILEHCNKETVDISCYPLATIKHSREICEGILTLLTPVTFLPSLRACSLTSVLFHSATL